MDTCVYICRDMHIDMYTGPESYMLRLAHTHIHRQRHERALADNVTIRTARDMWFND